jgi:glycyl-tRNA synthetase beta chain
MTDTQDLLFELGTEELPPVALKQLSLSLASEFKAGLKDAMLDFSDLQAFATPRRLAIIAKDCSTRQPDRDIQRRGPAVQAAFDAEGNPTKAAEGFARSCGTSVDQLDREKTDKGEWLAYKIQEVGKPADQLLPDIADKALSRLPIPKRMRWGDGDAQFVRPVHWLLFLHGKDVVDCELLGAKSGQVSYGHRFHHPDAININNANEYINKLEDNKVIVDFNSRRNKIQEQVNQQAQSLGGKADMDDALLDEVTALVEWPIPITAGFEEKYLEVPNEALIYTMKKNQKYFPVLSNNGSLMNNFITIANIESSNPDVIRDGNERVVRPRLADAMFFWQQDGKKKLEDHLNTMKSVVFQKDLGSMYDKSERVANLAGEIALHIGGDIDLARRAGLLSRCDLMTETVGEFAEMQGIMGRHQAQRDGEPKELAQAMDEFYMPRFSGDDLPKTKTGIAISLAEKIDTLVGIFGIGMKPTGDKDPFALRRAALGALRILKEHALTIDLHDLLKLASEQLGGRINVKDVVDDVYDFMINRLKGIYTDAAVPVETFVAVAQRRPGNIADFDQRLQAVIAFQKLPESKALAAANKRISNILKKATDFYPAEPRIDLLQQTVEIALHDKINEMSELVTPLLLKGDYENTLKSLAALREPVDTFFDEVMVMTDDEVIKSNRLSLLTRLQHLFLQVADISHL